MTAASPRTVLLALLIAPASSGTGATQPRDEAAIRQVQVRQAEAWNRHDATAYAGLFTADGEVVNVVGTSRSAF